MGDGNHLEREVVHGMIKLGGWAAGRLWWYTRPFSDWEPIIKRRWGSEKVDGAAANNE